MPSSTWITLNSRLSNSCPNWFCCCNNHEQFDSGSKSWCHKTTHFYAYWMTLWIYFGKSKQEGFAKKKGRNTTNSRTRKITFVFVPGHAGLKKNEGVDSFDSTDSLAALRDSLIWKTSLWAKNSNFQEFRKCISRLTKPAHIENNIIHKRLLNQHGTGTTSHRC